MDDPHNSYLLILSGNVNILTRTNIGRNIVLYHLGYGDSYGLTASCMTCNGAT